MHTPEEILKIYWDHNEFRPKQKEIVEAVLNGEDTLALLPTGGGKSVCYQVPAMMQEGLCLVVSPLIALMEDQIQQLQKRGIKAIAITSGMSHRQIDIALDNAIYGETKFLYVSPERLKTRLFLARFGKMKVNLIAVDEAHCISEWGYDFRPSYLAIADLRLLRPKIPFLALTATATSNVVKDIQEKLAFKKEHVIKRSFERTNLTYNTWQTNNKLNKIESFIQQNQGSGIIYCATRRNVKSLYVTLANKGYSVDYYHAGLDYEERKKKQIAWTENKTQIIIATNAFGMGIDKPDVRFVLHYDVPQSVEAYFQEAGRGGRDEKEAVAHLFFETKDIQALKEKVAMRFPPIETIKRIYNALGNHFQIAIGAGRDEVYPLDLPAFAEKYDQPLILVYNALKFLELCDYIKLSENYKQPSRLKFLANNQELYNFQVRDGELNKIILFILRTEMGVFEDYVKLNEFKIAQKVGLSKKTVLTKLNYLAQFEAVDYIPKSELPTITFITERLMDSNMSISPKFYKDRKEVAENKLEAMIDYLSTKNCKSQFLLAYFGEENGPTCGKCNNCKALNTNATIDMEVLMDAIKKQGGTAEFIEIISVMSALKVSPNTETEVLELIRMLAEHNKVITDPTGKKIKLS